MISDYSAILFDYCILERPIFCFGYDYDEFASKRGFYVDIEKELPNGIQKTEKVLLEAIKKIDYKSACQRTTMFKNKYLEFGGNATEICAKTLINGKE